MRFVIAAGGTGGHLFPGLAVGEVLLSRGHEVLLLISEKEIDTLATRGRSDFKIERLPGIGLPRLFSLDLFTFWVRFVRGLNRCRKLFQEFRPAAVLGMGGFTSTAPIVAGRLRRLPTFIHESNAIPGKANRLNGWLSNRVLLGFSECARYFPPKQTEVTGTPVRSSLVDKVPRDAALASFGFAEDRFTLLVMGGSQGARGINRALLAALSELRKASLQIIHLSGQQDLEELRRAYQEAGIPSFVAAFHGRMEEAYSAADLAVARSGAASLTELAHFGIPSVLIPYPSAADDHQMINARIFERVGAAIVMEETALTPLTFATKVAALVHAPALLASMAAQARKLSVENAAVRVADAVLAVVR